MPAALHDILAPDLRVLLVAINPATASAELGQHFATPTNAFWPPWYRELAALVKAYR